MALADGMFLLGYVVLFGAFIVAMLLSQTNQKVKWQKVDVERLQKEVSELRQARWDYERKLQEQLRELRTELYKQFSEERAATEKLAEKLRHEFRPETTKNMAAELLKRMQEDWMKQLDRRVDRLEKHDLAIRAKESEEDIVKRQEQFREIKRNLRVARGLPPLDDEQQPPNEEAKN